mgnify:CR=1 FL=1
MPEGFLLTIFVAIYFYLIIKAMKKFIYLLAVAAIVAACTRKQRLRGNRNRRGGADGDTVCLQK